MPKLRRAASVRSAKSVAVHVTSKIGGRKSKVGVAGLSSTELLKEATHIKRSRDKTKLLNEVKKRGLTLEAVVSA